MVRVEGMRQMTKRRPRRTTELSVSRKNRKYGVVK